MSNWEAEGDDLVSAVVGARFPLQVLACMRHGGGGFRYVSGSPKCCMLVN